MSTIRAFIAIELSDEARAVLADVGETLAHEAPREGVKWVDPDRMHLTLRFLGDTAVERIPDLATAMDEVGGQFEPFTLILDSLGCFPNERKPRVVWVGVQGDVSQVEALSASLNRVLEPLGWEAETRSFRAHLTLGRVKDRRGGIVLPWGKRVAPAQTRVHEIVLFESRLEPEGPFYIVRHRSELHD